MYILKYMIFTNCTRGKHTHNITTMYSVHRPGLNWVPLHAIKTTHDITHETIG